MKKILVISLLFLITFGFGMPISGENSGNSSLQTTHQSSLDTNQIQLADNNANNEFLNLWTSAKLRNQQLKSSLSYEIETSQLDLTDVSRYFDGSDSFKQLNGLVMTNSEKIGYLCAAREPRGDSQEIIVAQEEYPYPDETPSYEAILVFDGNEALSIFPGSGTEDDPFVIEGLNFLCTNNLIAILNTDAHVVLQYNNFGNVDEPAIGMYLNNTEHVTVQYNNFTKNSFGVLAHNASDLTISTNYFAHGNDTAIFVENSHDVRITDNFITDSRNGITLSATTDSHLLSNHISYNAGNGISLVDSDFNFISDNEIHHNQLDGIFLQDANYNVIASNVVYTNGYIPQAEPSEQATLQKLSLNGKKLVLNRGFSGSAIFIDPSVGNSVLDNVVYDNSGIGILLEYTNETKITGNEIYENGLTGIFFTDSNHNEITDNVVRSNGDPSNLEGLGLNGYDLILARGFSGSAIFIDPSYDNLVADNTLTDNLGNGLALEYSENTTIHNNTIAGNDLTGISFVDSNNNAITDNILNSNGVGGSEIAANVATNAFELKLMRGFSGSAIFIDPSSNNYVSGNVMTGNSGVGVYVQSSDNTVIENNKIQDNWAEAVFFENSSENQVTDNFMSGNGFLDTNYVLEGDVTANTIRLMRGFSGSAIFIDPSENNIVTDNVITGNAGNGIFSLESDNGIFDGNSIFANDGDGIALVNSDNNLISSNSIDNNGYAEPEGAITLLRGFSGSAIFIDPSDNNKIINNNASENAEYAVFIEASSNTVVEDNKFERNTKFAVAIDEKSFGSRVAKNNFLDNNAGETQAYNDAQDSIFDNNFWSDHDNTDANYDGIADEPYKIAGAGEATDSTSSNIKQGLNFYTSEHVWTNPRKLNVDSHGRPFVVKIRLDDGYRALQLEADKFTINGTVTAQYAEIRDILTIKLVFARSDVNQLVKDWEDDCRANQEASDDDSLQHRNRRDRHSEDPCKLSKVVFEVNGRMNDNLLDLTAYPEVKIKHNSKHSGYDYWKQFYKWCVTGIAIVPIGKKIKPLTVKKTDL